MKDSFAASLPVSGNQAKGARPNRSGYPGVSYHRLHDKWVSYVTVDGKPKHVAICPTAGEANAKRLAYIAEHGVAPAQSKPVGRPKNKPVVIEPVQPVAAQVTLFPSDGDGPVCNVRGVV